MKTELIKTETVERTLEAEATAEEEETESTRKVVVEATIVKASEPEVVEGLTELGRLELSIFEFAVAVSSTSGSEPEETVTTELIETKAMERALEAEVEVEVEAMAEDDAETIRKVAKASKPGAGSIVNCWS